MYTYTYLIMNTMEENGEKKMSMPAVTSIVIVVVIIIGTTFLGVWLYQKSQKTNTQPQSEIPAVETPVEPALSAEELRENFVHAVDTLIEEVATLNTQTSTELISYVEDRLMTIRVPSEEKDTYLNVFLAIENLKKTESESVDSVKTKMIELISSLR